jgi:hypothetical protein
MTRERQPTKGARGTGRASHSGRDPEDIARDVAAIRAELRAIDDAQGLWLDLERLARSELASSYTKRRANAAAIALGSLLDDVTEHDAAEQAFTWNDPPDDERRESPWPWDEWDGPKPDAEDTP